MKKPSSSSASIFLILNLLCFALTLANGCNTCIPQPKPTPTPKASCPRDALKLGVCATLLNGPVNVVVGSPPVAPCCSLLDGLVDLEVAACLCTAIKANILGINLNIPVSLSLLVNICGKNNVPDFQCA